MHLPCLASCFDAWERMAQGMKDVMSILIETVVGGLLVFLVTYIVANWRKASPVSVIAQPIASLHDYEFSIALDNGIVITGVIRGTQDVVMCKAIRNEIDRALLAWRVRESE